jgi:SOS-response transcriptional repressor LexA
MPASSPALTPPQAAVLDFVIQRLERIGVAPTNREIRDHFEYRSPAGAACHLRALVRKKYLERTANADRGIAPVRRSDGSPFVLPSPPARAGDDLTAKQRAVLRFIVQFRALRKRSPSLRDICEEFGWSSTNAVTSHLKALTAKKYIARAGERAPGTTSGTGRSYVPLASVE